MLLACGDVPVAVPRHDATSAEVAEVPDTFDPRAAASFVEHEIELGVPVPPATSVAQTLRLRNDGAEPVRLSSLELWPSKPVFTVLVDGRSIVATGELFIPFDPPMLVAPLDELIVQVIATGVTDTREVLEGSFGLVMPPGSQPFARVWFTVNAGPAPCLAVVDALAFGVCPVHASCTRDLTLESCGDTPVTVVFDVAQHGITAPFILEAGSATLAPGQILVVPVTFAPTLRGEWADRLVIHADAVPSVREVHLTGLARIQ